MKYLKLFAVALMCMLLPAIGIVYYKYQTSMKYNKLKPVKLRNGDIIFQTSMSSQSKAIQLATHSPYSHCGIVYQQGGEWYVFEAIQPVTVTPLSKWVKRGKDAHYVVKRLKDADKVLTVDVQQRMKQEGEKLLRKNYDLRFEWSDKRIYCSELVWKLYDRSAHIQVGELQHLKDFNLSHPAVQAKMKQRYGNKLPLNEPVISPAAIYNSPRLVTVVKG
jgi:hypothetical protein